MDALLGKITDIEPLGASASGWRVRIRLTPTCLFPSQRAVAEWLRTACVCIERTVADQREVGAPGDAMLLSAEESACWLSPLRVTPAVAYGTLPDCLAINLLAWPDAVPPPVVLRANGRQVGLTLSADETGWVGSVPTADLLPPFPTLPITISVACGPLHAACTVLPAQIPFVQAISLPDGPVQRLANAWYAIDITAQTGGGALVRWLEQAREIDHFARPAAVIGPSAEIAGHLDRFTTGWKPSDQLKTLALPIAGSWRTETASHLQLDGPVQAGQQLHTAVACMLDDRLPVLRWERSFRIAPPEKPHPEPLERIDTVLSFGSGFHAAWVAEWGATTGSRIYTANGVSLVTLRLPLPYQREDAAGWSLSSGWLLAHHPGRSAAMLYLFDRTAPPRLHVRTDPVSLIVEPFWSMRPLPPGSALGHALAITAGECCGAAAAGAWVACRAMLPDGTVRCTVIARLRDDPWNEHAMMTMDTQTQVVPLHTHGIAGVGTLAWAQADFPGSAEAPLTVTVAGIAQREEL